jgi:adenine-specific DNA glycosylase
VQILHGRRVCKPKPLCDQCSIRDDCDYFEHVIKKAPVARASKARPARTVKVRTTRGKRRG